METSDKLDFKAELFAIKQMPGGNTERKSIGYAPIRGFWGDTIAIQLDCIEPLVEKVFPYSQHHGEGVFKDSEGSCNISIEGADTTNEWDDLEFESDYINIIQYTGERDNEGKKIYK